MIDLFRGFDNSPVSSFGKDILMSYASSEGPVLDE